MEHIVGGQRLNKYLELHPKDIDAIRRKVIQIIQALGSALIRHRDVTYENLMVDNQGRLWLIDFGRAQRISSKDVDTSFEHDLAIYDDTIQDYFLM
jgi:RIO-like serine/threonine protein kinase